MLQIVNISDESVQIIKHCRKSLLFNNNTPWAKKSTAENFDVTMGSYDGAEICELVGIYIFSELSKIANQKDCGLYRDDGLILLQNSNGKRADKLRKDIAATFKSIGFQIEIKCNLKQVDFLDVTLNLNWNTPPVQKR